MQYSYEATGTERERKYFRKFRKITVGISGTHNWDGKFGKCDNHRISRRLKRKPA